MKLEDLGFYCVDCGKMFKNHEVEKPKIEVSGHYKSILECPECHGNDFQIYSTRSY